ncbi:hypothetical protein B738_03310 [Photorhabdus temperata subsp. temperata M1021]|nr:hypothetical protein B738_03310 [Photorhabdus temperata subsp. temperata M1021]
MLALFAFERGKLGAQLRIEEIIKRSMQIDNRLKALWAFRLISPPALGKGLRRFLLSSMKNFLALSAIHFGI